MAEDLIFSIIRNPLVQDCRIEKLFLMKSLFKNLVSTTMHRVGFPGMTACKALRICAAFQTPLASWQKCPPNNFDKYKKKISLSFQGAEDLIFSIIRHSLVQDCRIEKLFLMKS